MCVCGSECLNGVQRQHGKDTIDESNWGNLAGDHIRPEGGTAITREDTGGNSFCVQKVTEEDLVKG